MTSNEALRLILRGVLGDIDLSNVTRGMLWDAAFRLCGEPGQIANEGMEFFCQWFVSANRNANYNTDSNGEEWLVSRLPDAKVVFDVGANLGLWSLMARKHMPHADIRAYEPVPATAAQARVNLKDSNVTLFEYGLGREDQHGASRAIATYVRHSGLANLYDYPHGDETGKEVIVKLRAGCHEMDGIDRIDLLKIDAEGAECDILDGFKPQGRKIDVIQFEYGRTCIPAGWLLKDIYELLGGYFIGKLYPSWVDFQDYHPEREDFLGANYVAVRKDRMDLVARLKKEGA